MTAAKWIVAIFLVVNYTSANTEKSEIGHRDERCPMINPKIAKLLPHDDDCTLYYICESGIAIQRECPDELHFNPKSLVCDFPDRAGCELEHSSIKLRSSAGGFRHRDCPSKNPKNPVILPNHEDCGKFYICDGGMAFEKTCQPGLHFNPKLRVCDYPSNVNCANDGSSEEEKEDSTHPEPEIEKKGREGSLESTGFPSPFCPTTEGKYPIFFKHPSNCSVYYMCSNGMAYQFNCPARLHFNLDKKECDYEVNVNCSENEETDYSYY